MDLQFADRVQMAVADISTSGQRHNCSNGCWTTYPPKLLGLLAQGNVAASASTEIETADCCPAELEIVEDAARKKKAMVEHRYDAESEALPEDKKSGLLVCVAVVQVARSNPLVAAPAGRWLWARLTGSELMVDHSAWAVRVCFH